MRFELGFECLMLWWDINCQIGYLINVTNLIILTDSSQMIMFCFWYCSFKSQLERNNKPIKNLFEKLEKDDLEPK